MAREPLHRDGDVPPVGYGRPPAEHQIKDGERRNPWGRRGKPKLPVDFLDETITITVKGEACEISRRDALDHFLFNKAAKGDVRAVHILEARARQRQGTGDMGETELSPAEREAFERYIRREAERLTRKGEP